MVKATTTKQNFFRLRLICRDDLLLLLLRCCTTLIHCFTRAPKRGTTSHWASRCWLRSDKTSLILRSEDVKDKEAQPGVECRVCLLGIRPYLTGSLLDIISELSVVMAEQRHDKPQKSHYSDIRHGPYGLKQ